MREAGEACTKTWPPSIISDRPVSGGFTSCSHLAGLRWYTLRIVTDSRVVYTSVVLSSFPDRRSGEVPGSIPPSRSPLSETNQTERSRGRRLRSSGVTEEKHCLSPLLPSQSRSKTTPVRLDTLLGFYKSQELTGGRRVSLSDIPPFKLSISCRLASACLSSSCSSTSTSRSGRAWKHQTEINMR